MGMLVEELAKELHEAGREAVKQGATVNPTGSRFLEWAEITEQAREGRRIQARHLLSKLDISPRVKVETVEDVQAAAKRGFNS